MSDSPVLLIADDDPAFSQWMRERVHDDTRLGVLVANNLTRAKQLLEATSIRIDAISADLLWLNGTDAPEYRLLNGIDILKLAKKQRPHAAQYVLSIYSDRDIEHEQAQKAQVPVRQWFPKYHYFRDEIQNTPWKIMENDLVSNHNGANANTNGDNNVDNKASPRPQPRLFPQVTYLQVIPGYELTTPIEVAIRRRRGAFVASASTIPLLLDGEGDTVDVALEDLGALIAQQYKDLRRKGRLHPYSDHLLAAIRRHLDRDSDTGVKSN